jgi:hypothetical protein
MDAWSPSLAIPLTMQKWEEKGHKPHTGLRILILLPGRAKEAARQQNGKDGITNISNLKRFFPSNDFFLHA